MTIIDLRESVEDASRRLTEQKDAINRELVAIAAEVKQLAERTHKLISCVRKLAMARGASGWDKRPELAIRRIAAVRNLIQESTAMIELEHVQRSIDRIILRPTKQ